MHRVLGCHRPHNISQQDQPRSGLVLRQANGKSVWSGPQALVDWAIPIFLAISCWALFPGIRNIPCSVLPKPASTSINSPYTVHCQPPSPSLVRLRRFRSLSYDLTTTRSLYLNLHSNHGRFVEELLANRADRYFQVFLCPLT